MEKGLAIRKPIFSLVMPSCMFSMMICSQFLSEEIVDLRVSFLKLLLLNYFLCFDVRKYSFSEEDLVLGPCYQSNNH